MARRITIQTLQQSGLLSPALAEQGAYHTVEKETSCNDQAWMQHTNNKPKASFIDERARRDQGQTILL